MREDPAPNTRRDETGRDETRVAVSRAPAGGWWGRVRAGHRQPGCGWLRGNAHSVTGASGCAALRASEHRHHHRRRRGASHPARTSNECEGNAGEETNTSHTKEKSAVISSASSPHLQRRPHLGAAPSCVSERVSERVSVCLLAFLPFVPL